MKISSELKHVVVSKIPQYSVEVHVGVTCTFFIADNINL